MKKDIIVQDGLGLLEVLQPKSVKLILTEPPYAHGGNGWDTEFKWIATALEKADVVIIIAMLEYAATILSQYMSFYRFEHVLVLPEYAHQFRDTKNIRVTRHALILSNNKESVKGYVPEEFELYLGSDAIRETEHPAELPVSYMKFLIERYSDRGNIVLDPFCGTGATLVAAKELERQPMGAELVDNFRKTAEERLR